MGHSRYFPQAANMNKIVWSRDLADSAQRWADQCNPAIRPDREDECRDLETVYVGQNIASITGTDNGVNVKNFIDIWFMQSLAYTGSVAYYNMSRNSKSNYFTQLIWATTNKVGCGRARFYIDLQPVDRLVCNFSPRGNMQRRPIYIIGYPSTQCNEGMVSDYEFPGLCIEAIKDTTDSISPTSLLRIIYSVTSEIDPIRYNFNTLKQNDTHGFQKMRHVRVYNNTFALKRDNRNFWGTVPNVSRNHDGFFQHKERGHSRVYHGHDHTQQLDYLHPNQDNKNFRRYHYTTTSTYEYSDEFYRPKSNQKCTRKSTSTCLNNCVAVSCSPMNKPIIKQCTRGQRNIFKQIDQGCQSFARHSCESIQPPCPCSTPKVTCASNSNPCPQNNNCICPNVDNTGNLCSDMRRNLDLNIQKEEIRTERFYEDVYEYDGGRHRDEHKEKHIPPFSQIDDSWKVKLNRPRKEFSSKAKRFHQFSERKRKRRETHQSMTFKPFWEVDEFKKQPQFKSMRYTTLSNKKSRKRKPMTSSTQKVKLATEPITIAITRNVKHPTEKYLSFEELLRLRKMNASEFNARRSGDATTAASVSEAELSTTEYTANTPFIRLKHCTRKLTCTWTAASLGENEGNADIANRGSRTPPGYVEGCTRTSTCTRDYMNRNKMDTLSTPSAETEADESNDEDYCEKRSLNVRRRDPNDIVSTEIPLPNTLVKRNDTKNDKIEDVNDQKEKDDSTIEYCSCDDDYLRNKRENNDGEKYGGKSVLKREVESYNTLSYGDLFYLVLRKIMEKWNRNKIVMQGKCLCNSASGVRKNVRLILILLIINFLTMSSFPSKI